VTPPARTAAGLTLLEVLAATLIFSLVMSVLVGSSQMGVQRAGDSARRLEASQLADAIVADLEIQMRDGIAPPLEREEWTSEDERYRIRAVDRSLQQALSESSSSASSDAAAAGPSAAGTTRIGGGGGIGALLAAELPEAAKHLHQYDIEIGWDGPSGPESLTRTTFAFDWQAAQVEFADLFAAAGAGGGSGSEDEDGSTSPGDDADDAPRSGLPGSGTSPGLGRGVQP
jgi:Tfp pilus assembly protein PilV